MGIALTIWLLVLTPSDTPAFWLTLAACVGLVTSQAVYWLFTHPVIIEIFSGTPVAEEKPDATE